MAKSINSANIDPAVKDVLQHLLLDLTALRNAHLALTAKLDLDATVTDVDYASLTDPAALNTTR
jgi:hypothetical protein